MKKFYYSLFAAATMMLAVTSCSQEEDFAQSSNETTRFSIQLDGATQSRAAGDGTTVDKLYYAVYSKGTDNVVFPYEGQYATADKVNGGWTLDVPLMKSETYDILFWAQKDKVNNTAYTFDNLKNITVNYDGVLSNKEDRDAFFNALNGFTASNSEHTIVLRRPFAQLNVATTKTDWDKAKTIYNSNNSTDAAPVTKSSVTVKALATQFNVQNGKATVAEGTDPVTVTFAANELLKDDKGNNEIIKIKQMVEGVEKDVEYTLLAMNYLLPVSEKTPNGLNKYEKEDEAKDAVEVEFTLYKGTDEQIVNVKVPSTPIQRNWRTNIIGDLLTGEGFDVIVDGEFDNEVNQEIEISANGIVKDENGIYHITKTEGLWALANLVNNGSQNAKTGSRAAAVGYTFDNETFVLDCDIDLQGKEWTPMDNFKGTFDGKGKTISNFKVNKTESAGLFGNLGTGATIKNLTVTNATILSNHWAGVIAGRGLCVNFIGCTVENSSVTVSTEKIEDKWDNGDKAGSIIGYISGEPNALIENCSAKDVTIQAYRDLGGIVGYASGYENGPAVIKGNKVENIVLVIDNTNPYKTEYDSQEDHDAGAIVGEAGVYTNVESDNTSTEGTVTIIYTSSENYVGYYKDTEGNYCVTEDKGIEAVMDINEAKIKVILKNDVEVNVTSWQTMAFGGDQTNEIVINGENNKLTFNLNDSDWSNVTTANNAKLILNNLEIVSSGYNSGHWKRNGVCFNCPVEMNNVVSEAILLEQNATLNNVEINETSGAYSIWIWANGQTVDIDGLTINAGTNNSRAIAIKDEDAKKEKVTLNVSNATITSASKAAILVTSIEGADITLNNVDITNVAADKIAAVWVDEDRADYFDKVKVTGGKKALENGGYYIEDNKYYATNSNGITALIKKQIETINLVDGSFTMPDGSDISLNTKTLSIIGSKNAVLDVAHIDERDQFVTGANLSFEGITLNFGKNNYMGFANTESLSYKDCDINGLQFFYGSGTTSFENCDLNSNGAEHCAWTWGGQNISFTDCDFTYSDRAINCYGEGVTTNAEFTNCTFTKVEGKAVTGAIETNSSALKALNLTITNCSVNEGNLWWISEWDSKDGENTKVIINNEQVFPVLVAFIGTTGYTSLDEALKVAVNGDEVMVKGGEYYPLNGGGKNITISAMENETVIFKLRNQGEEGCDYGFGGNGTGVGTYVFNNITFDTTENTGNYKGYAYMGATYNNCNFVGAWSLNNANTFNFNNCTFDFKNGYFWTWGANEANFKGCTFNGNSKNILAHGWASTTINIEDCKFAATEKGFTGSGDNTACVEIDPAGTNTYTINFTGNNTKTESYAGWTRVKDGSTGHTITGIE